MNTKRFNSEKVQLVEYLQLIELSDLQIDEIIRRVRNISCAALLDFKDNQNRAFKIAEKRLSIK